MPRPHLVNFPQAVPDSAGIPASGGRRNADRAVQRSRLHPLAAGRTRAQVAGIIVEPLQRIIPPAPGFLQRLREECDKHGIVLIFDEIVTGFRFAYGGAQELYGVTPDLCTLGKIIGGGFPLAAIAGRAEIMAHFDKATRGRRRVADAAGHAVGQSGGRGGGSEDDGDPAPRRAI